MTGKHVCLTAHEARALLRLAEMFFSGDESVLIENTLPADRAAFWRAARKIKAPRRLKGNRP
jgi:hypothetical protein